jgi:hypothetical protein
VYSEPFRPTTKPAGRGTRGQEQIVPGDTTGISYEDKQGRWHDELSKGTDRPETEVEGEAAVNALRRMGRALAKPITGRVDIPMGFASLYPSYGFSFVSMRRSGTSHMSATAT